MTVCVSVCHSPSSVCTCSRLTYQAYLSLKTSNLRRVSVALCSLYCSLLHRYATHVELHTKTMGVGVHSSFPFCFSIPLRSLWLSHMTATPVTTRDAPHHHTTFSDSPNSSQPSSACGHARDLGRDTSDVDT